MNFHPQLQMNLGIQQGEQQGWDHLVCRSLYEDMILTRTMAERLLHNTAAFVQPSSTTPFLLSLNSQEINSSMLARRAALMLSEPSMPSRSARSPNQDIDASNVISSLIARSESAWQKYIEENERFAKQKEEDAAWMQIFRDQIASNSQPHREIAALQNRIAQQYSQHNEKRVDLRCSTKEERDNAVWVHMFRGLLEYKREHAESTVVPRKYIDRHGRKLGRWVDEQRRRKRAGKIRTDRVEYLESVGFAWDGRKAFQEQAWNTMYQRLLSYKKNHGGSTVVPQEYTSDPKLGLWVHDQRKKMKTGKLSEDRISALNSIGFTWEIRQARNEIKDNGGSTAQTRIPNCHPSELLTKEANHGSTEQTRIANFEPSELLAKTTELIDLYRATTSGLAYTNGYLGYLPPRTHR